jgi:hypothetical protein
MASVRYARFQEDASRARDLIGLGDAIGSMTVGRVDGSDLHRAAIVQAVGALDAYIHGIVLERAVEILLGRRKGGAARSKIGLHFDAVESLLSAATLADRELAARTYVAERLALETFQRPDDIATALSMVGLTKIWSAAFSNPSGTKTALGVIVDRRNRIVHACDRDPLIARGLTPISASDALFAVETIESIVAAIDLLC